MSITEVRLLTALEPPRTSSSSSSSATSTTSTKTLKHRFSFSSIPWPFLPQVPCTRSPISHEDTISFFDFNGLRQRRLVSTVPVAPVLGTPSKVVSTSTTSSPSWSSLLLLVLQSLRTSFAPKLLGAAVCSALLVLLAETVTCLLSLVLASDVPPGLMFLVGAVTLMGFVAARAIAHDSASIRRRKSSVMLLQKKR